jgi:hypothetical protein
VGTGVYQDYQNAIQIIAPSLNRSVLPEPSRVDLYEQAYRTYCEIYPAIKRFNKHAEIENQIQ